MPLSSFSTMVLDAFSPVFLATLTWSATKLAQYIRAKVQNEQLAGALLQVDDAILTAVKAVQTTLVDELKAASAGGKITAEERKQVKDRAIATAMAQLGPRGRTRVARALGRRAEPIEELLSSKVEAAVHDLRHSTAAATRAACPPASLPSRMAA